MANQDLVTQFRALSTINKIGLGLAGLNAIGIVFILAQVAGLSGMKSDLQSSINDASDKFTTAVDFAVQEMQDSVTSLSCSGTYSGKLKINFPDAPTSFNFSGRIFGSSIYGDMTSFGGGLGGGLFSSDTESGSITLSCE
jgi:hypothetical protein